MLVIFSDTHLSDETTSRNVNGSAFELLGKQIAAALSPEHKNARRVDLLLLGDIFDLVRTSYWHDQRIPDKDRPWNGKLDSATGVNAAHDKVESQFLDIVERILATDASRAMIKMIKGLPTLESGRPTVTYVVGNHDRYFHSFPALQASLRRQLPGIAVEFKTSYRSDAYQVLARHGHEWDHHNHGWQFLRKVLQPGLVLDRFDPAAYMVQCLGDVLTAELLSGMFYRLRQELSDDSAVDQEFLRGVHELNNLRPFLAVFEWLAWFSEKQPAPQNMYLDLLRQALRDALAATLDSRLARLWDTLKTDLLVYGDLTDQLARAHSLLRHKKGLRLLAGFKPVANFLAATVGLDTSDDLDDCATGAMDDFASEEKSGRSTQYVFYGHTHEARQECFRRTRQGRVQLYINTGTFLPFVERARGSLGFWTAHRLTFALVHADDEDRRDRRGPGPTLDLWNGIRCKQYAT